MWDASTYLLWVIEDQNLNISEIKIKETLQEAFGICHEVQFAFCFICQEKTSRLEMVYSKIHLKYWLSVGISLHQTQQICYRSKQSAFWWYIRYIFCENHFRSPQRRFFSKPHFKESYTIQICVEKNTFIRRCSFITT